MFCSFFALSMNKSEHTGCKRGIRFRALDETFLLKCINALYGREVLEHEMCAGSLDSTNLKINIHMALLPWFQ